MTVRGLAVLFVALLAAGCVALPSNPTPATPSVMRVDNANTGSFPVDAVVGLARADALAQEWSSSAALHGVIGTEGVFAQPDDPPYSYDTSADPHVGDGLALAWTFIYAAPERSSMFVVTIAGDDSVLYHREVSNDRPQPVGPSSGAVVRPFTTSTDAAKVVMANETAKRFVDDHPTTLVHLGLFATPEGSEWSYVRATTSGFVLMARVNASSGALITVDDGPHAIEPPMPPEPPCMGCRGPGGTPPPLPPPEDTRKNVTLNAFNTGGDMAIASSQFEFAYDLVAAADVPGSTPLDARTIALVGPAGDIIAQKSGTGHLEITVKDAQQELPPGAPYRLTVSAQTPPPQDQVVVLSSHIAYTRYLGYMMRSYSGGGGSVNYQQTSDSAMRLPSNANATFRLTFTTAGPAGTPSAPATAPGGETTWQVLDPKGTAIANGTSAQGTADFPTGAGGEFTLRVTGGSEAAFGQSYRWSVAATGPAYMM